METSCQHIAQFFCGRVLQCWPSGFPDSAPGYVSGIWFPAQEKGQKQHSQV